VTGPRETQDRQRLVAVVRGLVQGVGYRWFVQREASRLRLSGWVANMADGSVEVVAEGSHADLEQLVAALREGPSAALVDEVRVRHEPARGGLGSFDIRSGAHRGD
jgi:acylphosphatase